MPLPRNFLIAVLAIPAAAGQAAEFEGSVPSDLVRYFAGGGVISEGLPADFPALSLPPGLSLMGSFARSNEEKVLLRTNLAGEEAEQALAEMLLTEGWQPARPRGRPGSVAAAGDGQAAAEPTDLCHDGLGKMQVLGEDGAENRVYLRRYDFVALPRLDCRGQERPEWPLPPRDSSGSPPVPAGAPAFGGEVPIELARYFVGGGAMLRDLPEDFPAFGLPAGLEALGALDTGNRQEVFLRSSLDPAEAQGALVRAFLSNGWMRLVSPAENRTRRGFLVPEEEARQAGMLRPAALCHDEFGRLQINAPYLDRASVYLARTIYPGRPRPGGRPSCAQENERLSRIGVPAGLMRFLPALEVPAATQARRRVLRDPMGLDPNAVDEEIRLAGVELAVEELERHFAPQFQAQGWVEEARWSGEVSAGSNWLLLPQDGAGLVGTFQALRMAEGEYELSFRMVPAGR